MFGLIPALFFLMTSWASAVEGSPLVSGLGVSTAHQELLARSIAENRKHIATQFERTHVGIEVLTAGSSTAHVSSVFGHSLLRFIDQDGDPMNDTVIGFEMLGLGKPDDLSKGLTGGYEVVPRAMTFSVFLVRYVLNEGRSLHRVVLPSTQENIAALKATIRRITEVSDLASDYNFFSNNCLTVLKNVLAEAGYPMPNVVLDIPTAFSTILGNTMTTYAPALVIPSVEEVLYKSICEYLLESRKANICAFYESRWRISNRDFKQLNYVKSFLKDDEFWAFLQKSHPLKASLIVNFWPYSLDKATQDLSISMYKIQSRLGQIRKNLGPSFIPMKEFLTIRDQAIYQRCEVQDSNCRKNRREAALQVWPEEVLQKFSASFVDRIAYERRRSLNLAPPGKKAIETWINSEIVQDMVQFNQ